MSATWYTRPILYVAELEASVRFYVDKLGFTEGPRHEDVVTQVSRAGCEILLCSQEPDRRGRGRLFISLDPDVLTAVRAELEGRRVAVSDGWWGYDLMVIRDPDGNELYFPYPAT